MQVRDAVLPLEDPGALELDVEVVEQPPPATEQHRDDVQLELVQDPGGQGELRGGRPVHQDVPVPRGRPRPAIAVATSST